MNEINFKMMLCVAFIFAIIGFIFSIIIVAEGLPAYKEPQNIWENLSLSFEKEILNQGGCIALNPACHRVPCECAEYCMDCGGLE